MDVEILEYVLEVPDIERKGLRSQSRIDEERKERLVKYFLHTFPNASWEWLGGKLLWCGEDVAVQEVKVHIKHNEGECTKSSLALHRHVGMHPCTYVSGA